MLLACQFVPKPLLRVSHLTTVFIGVLFGSWLTAAVHAKDIKLLNVSYDVTREFFQDYNAAFAAHWKEKTGDVVTINQSHGGSSKQARAVLDGLEADVVSMNQVLDIEILHERGRLIPKDWAARLPNKSVPWTSPILFIVRKGNPKGIKNWNDLVKPGISVIIPNPKTSGNGRHSYLGAWGYAFKKSGGDAEAAREFVEKLFGNVPVLDSGGRGAMSTFAQRQLGDVLLTFESEAYLGQKESGAGQFDIVVPPVSILAESPVVWVDKVVGKHGTADAARAYLEYLFSDAGQEVVARHYLRPSNAAVLARHSERFQDLGFLSIEEIFGGWARAQQVHFSEGGLFDQIYRKTK